VRLLLGGSIDINTAGGGVFSAGIGRTNAFATGLTIGNFGLAMDGNSISNVGTMTIDTLAPRSNTITCTANFNITGNLYAGEETEFYRGVNSATMYVRRTDAQGNNNGYYTIQINKGIIHNIESHDP